MARATFGALRAARASWPAQSVASASLADFARRFCDFAPGRTINAHTRSLFVSPCQGSVPLRAHAIYTPYVSRFFSVEAALAMNFR